MYKKLITNSAIYGILPQLPKIASFFVLPLITPYLTEVDYGVVGILSSYIAALAVFQLLGLNAVVSNAFYHHPSQYKWHWRQIYGFAWLWSLIYFSILGVIIYFTLPKEALEYRLEIIALKILPGLLFGPSDLIGSTYLRLRQKAWPVASRGLFAGLVGIGLNYYFIAVLKMGFMGWIVSEFITNTISSLLYFIPVIFTWKFLPIFNFKKYRIRKSLKISFPIIPHFYASYLLNSSDRVVMERMNIPTGEIGRYSLAYNFGVYIETITNAVNNAIGPNLLELIKAGKWRDYQRLIFGFQSLMLFICFTLSLWVPQWLPFLIRNKNLQDINVLIIVIIMSYSYRPIYIGCNQVLFYYEETKVLWRITFTAGALNLVGNFILLPIYGVEAAAITTFFSLMYMGFSGFFLSAVKKYNQAKLKPVLWFILIIAFMGSALYFYSHDIITKALVNIIFVGTLGAFLYFSELKPGKIVPDKH